MADPRFETFVRVVASPSRRAMFSALTATLLGGAVDMSSDEAGAKRKYGRRSNLSKRGKPDKPKARHATRDTLQASGKKKKKKKKKKRAGTIPPTNSGSVSPPDLCAGVVCGAVAHGQSACVGGTCLISGCDAGFGDCDGLVDTGCETDLQSDPDHCGACETVCPDPGDATITAVCGERTCQQVRAQDVVISQIYAGGGPSSNGHYNRDAIVLYNRGMTPVSLDLWAIHRAPASGTTWTSASLSGTIPAGGHYLIAGETGGTGFDLPFAPDLFTNLTLFQSAGRIALFDYPPPMMGGCSVDPRSCPGPVGMVDFVGYGSATQAEGNAPAPGLTSQTALWRRPVGGRYGCYDTNNNAADFVVKHPEPLNSWFVSRCPWAAES